VPIHSSELFADILRERNVSAELIRLRGVGHGIFDSVPSEYLCAMISNFVLSQIGAPSSNSKGRSLT
jgi:hypothetical protein